MIDRPTLIALGGLPGTGKTTIGKALAARRQATHIRIDAIEHALAAGTPLGGAVGPAGYIVGFAIASSNLQLGHSVVADSVNPVPDSREGWRGVARASGARLLEVEVICSDVAEHRRRVETRTADIAGFTLPTWSAVQQRHYVPWAEPRLVIDTAVLSLDDAVARIETHLSGLHSGRAVDS